jgi:hypothetical protein
MRQTIYVLETWLGNTGHSSGRGRAGKRDFHRSDDDYGLELIKAWPHVVSTADNLCK